MVLNSIELKSLTKSFGDVTAVNDISLSVKPGEIFGFLGPNGAGKSTFYRTQLAPLGLPFINADILAKELYPQSPEEHRYYATKLATKILTLAKLKFLTCFWLTRFFTFHHTGVTCH